MDLAQELRYLARDSQLTEAGDLVYLREIPCKSGEYGDSNDPFYSQIAKSLLPRGFYKHQLEALELIGEGKNVVIATSTSSGKSLCYQLPIVRTLSFSKKRSHRSKALVIHPTKALAHDQLRSWSKLAGSGILINTFDGDSSSEQRLQTKRLADVWLTNPEMINSSILANHGQYRALLSALSFIVVDEAHAYRGVFGSHVANLLKRLIRIAQAYGSDPQIIFTSATIGDPEDSCSKLINQPVSAVKQDSSPRSDLVLAIWKPKIIDEVNGTRASYSKAAALISASLATTGHRVITFVRSRRQSEVIGNETRDLLKNHDEFDVLSYRGGYLPVQRRTIEQLVTEGVTRILVTTSAMELGVDIGFLDSAVIAGFPGTFSSFRQQIGRVGRRDIPSAAILVCSPNAQDQWISSNPESLTENPTEKSVINPTNPFILKEHLRAACFESPLSVDELTIFSSDGNCEQAREVINELEQNNEIILRGDRYVTNLQSSPHHKISMRSSGGRQMLIYATDGELIGTTELDRAPSTLFEGAIYLHLGQSFKVASVDLERDLAIVEPYLGTEQTRTIFDTSYENSEPETALVRNGVSLCLGPTKITQIVTGYQLLSQNGELLSVHSLEFPPLELRTRAFWLEFQPEAIRSIPITELPGALHAAEHGMISMMPIFAICDRSDIGGVSRMLYPDPSEPELRGKSVASITIYDGYQGGIGIAELGFKVAAELIQETIKTVSGCGCEHGCPSCIQSPKCGNLNFPLNKEYARELLKVALAAVNEPHS